MRSILFPSRTRNVIALLVSLLALWGVAAYLTAPTNAIAAKLTASYRRASHTVVEGVVKSPNGQADRRGEVVLVFRDAHAGVIQRKLVKVNRNGRFHVVAPKAAKSVVLTVYLRPGGNAPHGSRTLNIVSGEALSVTVVFHHTSGGLLPAVFPY
jgi:hypothetical protein